MAVKSSSQRISSYGSVNSSACLCVALSAFYSRVHLLRDYQQLSQSLMAASTPRFKAPTVEVPTEDSSPALSRLLDTFSPRTRKLSKVGIAEVRLEKLDAAAIR